MPRPRLFLVDTFGFIFRAYHARAHSGAAPMRTSAGLNTEAVFIFHNMLRKLAATHQPDHMVAVFESAGPTFRDQEFEAYKANRPETPPELTEQIPWVRTLLEALRVPVLQAEGFEADDVIGTMARQGVEAGFDVVVVSADKDLMQLVGDNVAMLNPSKDDAWYDAAGVAAFMGVAPGQVADLLALKGDAVDNIPGAPGIGDKGAKDLILRFGSVEAALDHAAEVERKTYRESLLNNREQILLSKRLATVHTGAPIDFAPEAYAVRPPDTEALAEVYRKLEFFSLLKSLEAAPVPVECSYRAIETAEDLAAFLAGGAPVAVWMDAASSGELMAPPIGVSCRTGEGVAVNAALAPQIQRVDAAYNVKALDGRLPVDKSEDVMLYGFLLTAEPSACTLEALSRRYLNRAPSNAPEQCAEAVFALAECLRPEIEKQGLSALYRDIERPLAPVLARMERAGILVDARQLGALSVRMDTEIQRLTGEIHEHAGHAFNINSPQQLGKVLFEEMGIRPPGRGAKGKAPSTAADVLEQLAEEHPIAGKVLEYRQLTKLKGTYVDALPALIRPETGRVHTTFNQTGAATGRLSSSDPNLQNIPVRTELGREIRAAFVPREGWTMLVADYSQIELRLLAHMSRDPVLLDAFLRGEDIHTRTAAEVFGVHPMMVTSEMRRNAKAVNFGIVYGQSGFGLAQQLGIERREAESYIKNYFARYSGVRRFLDDTVAEVRRTGVVRTLLGRQRPIPDIDAKNPNLRSFAERTAVNTPLQGTAADLIKIAMIRIDAELSSGGYRSTMLLQVHDELVLECPPEELDAVTALVKRHMEGAYQLDVPLLAETGTGSNWRDAK